MATLSVNRNRLKVGQRYMITFIDQNREAGQGTLESIIPSGDDIPTQYVFTDYSEGTTLRQGFYTIPDNFINTFYIFVTPNNRLPPLSRDLTRYINEFGGSKKRRYKKRSTKRSTKTLTRKRH